MKALFAILVLLASASASAASIPVNGAPADALVNALVKLGLDPVGTHEYFQSGVTVCQKISDESGTYFPNGAVGDYIGEACLVYGDAYEADDDGALRVSAFIPADDRGLTHNPEIGRKLGKLRILRHALEALVHPLLDTVSVDGHEIILRKTAAVTGIACDGRDARGNRLCRVKVSSRCPPRQ